VSEPSATPTLTPDQEKAVKEQTDRVAELNRIAADPAVPQMDRIEAQNKLIALSMRAMAAQSGLSGGIKDILKVAGPQIERAEEAYRSLEQGIALLEGRASRLELNLKSEIERNGGKYIV